VGPRVCQPWVGGRAKAYGWPEEKQVKAGKGEPEEASKSKEGSRNGKSQDKAQKDNGCMFFSYVGDRHNTNTNNIMKNRFH
jgi:hypothetical protein